MSQTKYEIREEYLGDRDAVDGEQLDQASLEWLQLNH